MLSCYLLGKVPSQPGGGDIMKLDERIQQRFNELEQATNQVRIVGLDYDKHVDRESGKNGPRVC